MTILADENISTKLVGRLREEGHAVSWIMEGFRGVDDPFVLDRALASESILLTEDKDFGELVFSRQLETAGVLLLRLQTLSFDLMARNVCSAIRAEGDSLLGQFSVLTPAGLRTREI